MRRAAVLLAPAYCSLCLVASRLLAGEITPAEIRAAEVTKSQKIAAAKATLDALEAKRIEAVKKRRYAEVSELVFEVTKAREQLQAAKDLSVEALAQATADAERAAQEQRELAAASEREEQERFRLSGGCPLAIKGGDFSHVRGTGEVGGPRTVVRFAVTNPTNAPVEAWEVLVLFLDGFDRVVGEHRLQGTRIKPGETTRTLTQFPVAATAVVTKVFVERVRLEDDAMWERKPEFTHAGIIIKKPEGAWIN